MWTSGWITKGRHTLSEYIILDGCLGQWCGRCFCCSCFAWKWRCQEANVFWIVRGRLETKEMKIPAWSDYGLKIGTWKYESARYCTFHAVLWHFVDRSLGRANRPAGHRTTSSRHTRCSHWVRARHWKQWASESLGSGYVCTLWQCTLFLRKVRLCELYGSDSWGCMWCVKHEIQNKHPISRLWSMVKKSPHVRHICFSQENGNQIIIFYKILSFSHILLSYVSSVHDKSWEKSGETPPPFFITYLLDIFSCRYISFSIPDDCLRPKHVVYL
jgi:hypothetical protein